MFDLQAESGADAIISMSGGDFVQCDSGNFASSQLMLSSRHQPDGRMHTITIPLNAWDSNQLQTASGLHSIAFSFAPNPSNTVYRFDNFRLCDAGPNAPSPIPSAPMPSQAPASLGPTSSQAPQMQPSPQPLPQPSAGNNQQDNRQVQELKSAKTTDTSSTIDLVHISSLTILAIAATYLIVF